MTRDNIFDKMGLRKTDEEQQLLFYSTLTVEEKARMHPCTKATCVMMSGDSPGLDSRSIPASYDLPDDARPGELPPVIPLSSTGKLSHSNHDTDNETIEEVTTIVKKTLPSPEPRPKIYQKNGIDSDNNNKLKLENKFAENNKEDNDACVNCLYYTQQFCECVIL
ncbi:uncharacterized protein LOC123266510 isoform X2 [Cotesia glomerata]|uniref:Uncharacterized protein n=1 Tax=Cotesia glomerata TaxID=32391 RepID=A0AAV7HVW5_COTGL|nr:uncharacterized protein LOC123266510 isoform X2 [Cotesia glomerata]KAH0535871.1 hypothetical protein KQX54_019795 [Cotesia glomerata]